MIVLSRLSSKLAAPRRVSSLSAPGALLLAAAVASCAGGAEEAEFDAGFVPVTPPGAAGQGMDAGLNGAGGSMARGDASTNPMDAAREGGATRADAALDAAAPDNPRPDATTVPDAALEGGAPPSSAVVKFSKNVKLNDDTGRGQQVEVTMAAGPDGLVLAGWVDYRAAGVCAFSFSTDGGTTWSKNISIANAGGAMVGDPAVAIDGGGTMYAICQQYINTGSTGAIRLMTSRDKGATWSAVSSIQSAPDKPWAMGGTANGTVFVSWLGNPGGIKRSTDHGATWGPTQSTGNIVHGTAIVTSTTGLVHVPYNLDSNRNQLRYLRSKNNGDSWETARDLLPDMGTFCFQCSPRQHPIVGAAADPTGKFVAITWASKMSGGEGDDDVWVLFSKDGGDTWSKPIRVNDNKTASRQFEPWVAVDAYGRVHVAWTDYRNGGKNETWYARSSDPTKGFEPNIQVTDGSGSGSVNFLGDYKGIVVQGDDVLVVWQDTRNDTGDIYFARAAGAAGPPSAP